MILKKPYAFLIKNFRSIHFLLTILSVIILISSHSVVDFFAEYIKNNYSVTVVDSLVSEVISPILYILIIITIIMLIAVYILLKNKNKPTKLYLFSIIYYIVLFISIIISAALINNLTEGLWSTTEARMYRDIGNIIYYPGFFFPLFMLIRALGFDVKKFNFKSDLKELEITEEDSEEIEVNLNFETYKYTRGIRRFIRELKYYYLENKLMFYLIGGILVIILGIFIYNNTEKTKYNYSENKSFSTSGFNFKITDSIITNLDLNGNIIDKDKHYVVIKFDVINNSHQEKRINYDNFKLYYGSNYVYPSLNMGNSFLDFGDPYLNDVIRPKDKKTYIMAYEIDKKYENSNFKIVLYLGESTKSESFLAKTATIKLRPHKYNEVTRLSTKNINEKVTFSDTLLKNTNLTIKSLFINNRYEYTYECGYKDSRYNCSDIVVSDASYQNKTILLVMDYDISFDTSAPYYENINNVNEFFSYFATLEYKINDIVKTSNVEVANPKRDINKIILETDGEIKDASAINLLITIRDKSYVIKIK